MILSRKQKGGFTCYEIQMEEGKKVGVHWESNPGLEYPKLEYCHYTMNPTSALSAGHPFEPEEYVVTSRYRVTSFGKCQIRTTG